MKAGDTSRAGQARRRYGMRTGRSAFIPAGTAKRTCSHQPQTTAVPPPLKYVDSPHDPAFEKPAIEPITAAHDPRWVLAVRTAEHLEGSLLTPENREKLIRLGRLLGLTLFDSNLIIAIVQDQARRGHAGDYCPTAGHAQLSMVPTPKTIRLASIFPGRYTMTVAGMIVCLIGLELIAIWWLLR